MNTQNASKPLKEGNDIPKEITREQVQEWVKRDVMAASYFLNMLIKYPDALKDLANQLYDKAQEGRRDEELLK